MQKLVIGIPIIAFLFTLFIGADLTWDDFKRLFREPKIVIVGLIGQLVLMPIVAFAIAWLFRDNIAIAIGIVLLAAAPGGPLSNSLVYVARARTELSVTLTAISGFVALVTTPIIATIGINLFAKNDAAIKLPIPQTIAQIFVLIILPLIIGMFVRYKWPDFVKRQDKLIRQISNILLILILVILVIVTWDTLATKLSEFALAATVFIVAMIGCSWLFGWATGLDDSARFTVMVEVVVQNIVVASLIAVTLLKRPEFAVFSAVYSVPVAFILFLLALQRGKAAVKA